MKINKRMLLGMGWLTLLGFGLIGWAIIYFLQHRDLLQLLTLNHTFLYQIAAGGVVGLLIAKVVLLIIEWSWFGNMKTYFVDLLGPIKLNWWLIVFISFCAGFGEELFFRGAIQHWLGIWITAFLFVLLHGYINPKNVKLSVYGLILVLASAAFGYLTNYVGLLSAMIAHTVYDIVMFQEIKTQYQQQLNVATNHQNSLLEDDVTY